MQPLDTVLTPSAQGMPIQPGPRWKTGQRVQVRQHEVLPEPPMLKADPPVQAGPIDFWIYGRVRQVNEIGSLLVDIDHPGNYRHAQTLEVQPADVRTKADVLALHDAVNTGHGGHDAAWKKHYQIQADRLD